MKDNSFRRELQVHSLRFALFQHLDQPANSVLAWLHDLCVPIHTNGVFLKNRKEGAEYFA
jgi:hypothetical protein